MGGTCLRTCYGSNRLSEDLDFIGGAEFNRESLSAMTHTLVIELKAKYGLHIEVSEPTRESGKVDTWKLKVQIRPDRKDIPAQRINIDVCAIPSYQRRPMLLLNPYGVEMGTSGLILQAESREEIFADKIVAFALRPNRIKYRDLWDMTWLHQQGVKLPTELVPLKLNDHRCEPQHYLKLLDERSRSLQENPDLYIEFKQEMRRFLPADLVIQSVDQPAFWGFVTSLVDDLCRQTQRHLAGETMASRFQM